MLLSCLVITHSKGKTDTGDYIVDCSACQRVPLVGVNSYSCSVRCSVEGESVENSLVLLILINFFVQWTSGPPELYDNIG